MLLTEQEIEDIAEDFSLPYGKEAFARAIESKVIEKIECLISSHWNPHKPLDSEQQISNEVVDYILENIVKFKRNHHEPKTPPSSSCS